MQPNLYRPYPPAILSVLTYLAKHASRKKSKANDLAILNHHLGYLRPRKLSTITREDIAKLHTKIGTEPSSVIRPRSNRPTSHATPGQFCAGAHALHVQPGNRLGVVFRRESLHSDQEIS